MYAFFGITILIGFVLINLGLAFNLLNRLRRRDWVHAFLDKFGLVGVMFYWGMVALGMRRLLTGRLDLWTLIVFVGIPLLVIMLQEPVRLILAGRMRPKVPHETGVGLALFLGLVEGLETVLNYLSNTLSFVRVAAFSLSHAALCLAVFAMAEVIAPSAGPVSPGRIAVLVLGNAFIICLEGLIAAIQTMRLEYYEFFSKFFVGEGKPYQPFTLDPNARTVRSPMERSTPR
ncbi:MAG: V-type ATPase 116kDa subunit family protein [Planctomycetota bacterium]